MYGHVEVVRMLLEGTADVPRGNADGVTALHWTAQPLGSGRVFLTPNFPLFYLAISRGSHIHVMLFNVI
jgi:hypothetical protein